MKYYVVQYYEPASERRTIMWSDLRVGADPIWSDFGTATRGGRVVGGRMTVGECRTFEEMDALKIIRSVEVDRTFHIIKS